MAQDINITVNNTINILLEKRSNIGKDKLKDLLIWILRSPNRNTALINCSIPRYSKTILTLNGKLARQSLFSSEQPNCYMGKSTNNRDRILLPGETVIKTID